MSDKYAARRSKAQMARDIEMARKDLGLTSEEFAKILWNRHTTAYSYPTLIDNVFTWEVRGMSTHNRYFIPCCEELGLIPEDYMSQRRRK